MAAAPHSKPFPRWPWIAGGIAALIVIAGGVGFAVNAIGHSGTMTVTGELDLSDGTTLCATADTGYSDIQEGSQVVITADGKTLAEGGLDAGLSDIGADGSEDCVFHFTVTDVPSGHSFYQIAVSHRGQVTFPVSQMKDGPVLTLGS